MIFARYERSVQKFRSGLVKFGANRMLLDARASVYRYSGLVQTKSASSDVRVVTSVRGLDMNMSVIHFLQSDTDAHVDT